MYKKILLASVSAIVIVALGGIAGYTAISSIAGLAVAQSSTKWNNLKDAGTLTGDAQSSGLIASGLLSFNGSTWDRVRGSVADGIFADVKKANICSADTSDPTRTAGTSVPCTVGTSSGNIRVMVGNAMGAGDYVGTNGSTWPSSISQPPVIFNTQTTGADNTAVAITLTAGASGSRTAVHRIDARCSAGTSSVTITNSGTTIWSTTAAEVTAARFETTWPVPLSSTNAIGLVITLATCGPGNTGTLTVQGSRA